MFFWTTFTIFFIVGFFSWGAYKLSKLSKEPPAPPLEKVKDK
jgi:high-affinity Fe2+/Pb2+ permease